MEIERKYLIHSLPFSLEAYPVLHIQQAYLCTQPVVRIRKQNDAYILTYKGSGLMIREEYNLPLTEDAYAHLLTKADGIIIEKHRFLIPYSTDGQDYTIELDIFDGHYKGLQLAEVEFESEAACNSFTPPEWFGEDVTFSKKYHNSTMSAAHLIK